MNSTAYIAPEAANHDKEPRAAGESQPVISTGNAAGATRKRSQSAIYLEANPFECNHIGCDMRFSTRPKLKRHLESCLKEPPRDEAGDICEVCGVGTWIDGVSSHR